MGADAAYGAGAFFLVAFYAGVHHIVEGQFAGIASGGLVVRIQVGHEFCGVFLMFLAEGFVGAFLGSRQLFKCPWIFLHR